MNLHKINFLVVGSDTEYVKDRIPEGDSKEYVVRVGDFNIGALQINQDGTATVKLSKDKELIFERKTLEDLTRAESVSIKEFIKSAINVYDADVVPNTDPYVPQIVAFKKEGYCSFNMGNNFFDSYKVALIKFKV